MSTLVHRSRSWLGRDVLAKGVSYAVLIPLSLFMVFPFLWMLVSSLKPASEIFAGTTFLPAHPTLQHYAWLFGNTTLGESLWNSFYIAALATTLSLFFCALGGYGFAKFEFPGRTLLFNLMLVSMTIPFVVTMVPTFVMMRNIFHWVDTPWPLIVPGIANAFGIFFMRQNMLAIPSEVLDAARIDGASEPRIFLRVALPVSAPALASLAILFFLGSWNSFVWPSAILQSSDKFTMPLLIDSLTGLSVERTAYGELMAASVLNLLPLLIAFLFLQRRLYAGFLTGAVKG